jgi:SAM-dependent methyltransferase
VSQILLPFNGGARSKSVFGERTVGYLLDNSAKEAPARFAALSALLDGVTVNHLTDLRVGTGWRCLEVGGGGGSIAQWLAERVGSTGSVLVTDLDPRHLEQLRLPNVEVRRHDITIDPLPPMTFDLVHCRLVLLHLPQRERALECMISSVKPGGWLLLEEYDSCSMVPDPSASPGEVFLEAHIAMFGFLEAGGVDRRYGRRLFGLLRAHGLDSVAAEGRTFMMGHGSTGAALLRTNLEQLRNAMIDGRYVTRQELDRDLARLDDPDFMAPSPVLWSAWGRKPAFPARSAR